MTDSERLAQLEKAHAELLRRFNELIKTPPRLEPRVKTLEEQVAVLARTGELQK